MITVFNFYFFIILLNFSPYLLSFHYYIHHLTHFYYILHTTIIIVLFMLKDSPNLPYIHLKFTLFIKFVYRYLIFLINLVFLLIIVTKINNAINLKFPFHSYNFLLNFIKQILLFFQINSQ